MRAIWESVLERDGLERDEDFFDAGGTSLAAMRVFARIHDELGVDLPLSSLLQAPTIATLAALIDRPSAGARSPIELARGDGGRPLFLLPWWTGEILHMRTLGTRIPTNRPVYGVVTDPVDATVPREERATEMAERCVESIRSIQPSGPYAFVGHSFGGLLGLEIARMLTALGEEVEFFGAIDTTFHLRSHSRGERIKWYAREVRRGHPRDLRRLAGLLLCRDAKRDGPLYNRAQRVIETPDTSHPSAPVGYEAWSWYRPRPYAGRMTLFRAEVASALLDPLPLWRRTVAGGVTVDDIPGSHYAGLDDTAVDMLAARIADKLNAPERSARAPSRSSGRAE